MAERSASNTNDIAPKPSQAKPSHAKPGQAMTSDNCIKATDHSLHTGSGAPSSTVIRLGIIATTVLVTRVPIIALRVLILARRVLILAIRVVVLVLTTWSVVILSRPAAAERSSAKRSGTALQSTRTKWRPRLHHTDRTDR